MDFSRYPIYIISKGRYDSNLTANALDRIGVKYSLVIEPQEYRHYSRVIDSKKIICLPFSNLGQGSIPARNFVWDHSISEGYPYHWILDDNIEDFYRLNRNLRLRVRSGVFFRVVEDFILRYENIAISGLNYRFLCIPSNELPPYYLNTRVYSCLLIRNDISYRWRGRYNEDTDLCLRVLKDKWCTVLFNAFLIGKSGTMQMKGGNTEELYKDDGRLKMAESLVEQHPDVTSITWKWNRWQHHVDYRPFKCNQLIKKEGLIISDRVNDYGLKLVSKEEFNNAII